MKKENSTVVVISIHSSIHCNSHSHSHLISTVQYSIPFISYHIISYSIDTTASRPISFPSISGVIEDINNKYLRLDYGKWMVQQHPLLLHQLLEPLRRHYTMYDYIPGEGRTSDESRAVAVNIRSKCTTILQHWMDYFRQYIEGSEHKRRAVVETWLRARKRIIMSSNMLYLGCSNVAARPSTLFIPIHYFNL